MEKLLIKGEKNQMKKIIESIKTKRWIHYLIIILVGILVSIPLFWLQVTTCDDGKFHLLRLIGLDNAMEHGSFPFLVFPFFCKDWGYSMMTFYPPLVTYIPYVLSFITGMFNHGLKIFAALTTIVSGIFMYNFINEVTKKKGIACISAILYMIVPYRFEDIYNRFAIGEFTSFIFIPIVFQGLYNLLHGDKKKHFYIAIGATGLLLTHTISTLYTAVFCVLYILFNIKLFFNKDVIKKCIINVIFILLMSAMFLIPMLEFKSQADYGILESSIMKTEASSAATRTIAPWQFLKDKGEVDGVSFVVGIHFIVMVFLGILAYRKMDKKYKDFYIVSIILGVIGLIMCTNLFPWQIMPDFMCTLQYPWRLLGFAFFFFVPVCAINVYYVINPIRKEWIRNLLYVLVIVILGIFTFFELTKYNEDNTSQDYEYETNVVANPEIHYFSINRDNMPVKALSNQWGYLKERTDNVYIISGEAEISDENKYALHMSFNIENASKGTELELPYLFYPGYTIKLTFEDKEIILDTTESEYGFLKIIIPEDIGNGNIVVDYTATTMDKVSYIISGISIIAFIVYIIYFRKKCKKEESNEK